MKDSFFDMLKEGPCSISATSSWSKKKKYFSDDQRYVAVGSSSLREDYFYEFTKSLESEGKIKVSLVHTFILR